MKILICCCSPFFFFPCFLTRITLKLYGVYERSAHHTTALLSDIDLYFVRAACELGSTSYASKHALRSLSDASFCTYVYTHNSKTNGRIRTFYLSNNYSTIGDIYSLGQCCMRDVIGEFTTRKLQVVYRHSIYRMTILLSGMSILCVRAGCKIRMASYGSKKRIAVSFR